MGQKDGPNSILFAADLLSARGETRSPASPGPERQATGDRSTSLSRSKPCRQGYNTSEVAMAVAVAVTYLLHSFPPPPSSA